MISRIRQKTIDVQSLSRNLPLLGLGCALVCAWPVPGQAGRIEGRIHFAGRVVEAGPNPYPGRIGSDLATEEIADLRAREVAVYLRGLRRSADDGAAPDDPEMRQLSLRFEPRVLAIPVGTTVAFPNLDPVFHNVFSYSKTRRFDLGRYGKGKSKSITFDDPGLVEVFCDVHSSMQAFILIVDSDFVTQPGGDGTFVIDGVPEGPQTLVVWHPDYGEQEFSIQVGAETVRFDLSF